MQFLDISHDQQTTYRLTENEQRVFFLLNRSGEITFELSGRNARAYIFAFFLGKDKQHYTLNLIQKHIARETLSQAIIKSTLADVSSLEYHGTVIIGKEAHQSDASQESRTLLLSEEASVVTQPNLEILAHDVRCHHAATTSPLNTDQVFYAKSRGLSDREARSVLTDGFLAETLEKMSILGVDTTPLRHTLIKN